MKNYHVLDLDWGQTQKELGQWYQSHYLEPAVNAQGTQDYVFGLAAHMSHLFESVPSLHHVFAPAGLSAPTWAGLYVSTVSGAIHRDTRFSVKINLPLLNCEQSETQFFNYDANYQPSIVPGQMGYDSIIYHEQYGTMIDSYQLTQPTVINTQVPHRVSLWKQSAVPRISLTMAFENDDLYQFLQ